MGALIESRRRSSAERLEEFSRELAAAEDLSRDRACVCAIGAFGRGEASAHRDLDLVILGRGTAENPTLTRLDQICVQADLVRRARGLGFPEFSGDGRFLRLHTADELVRNLGTEHDDVSNALTIRLLLLLESRPLFGRNVYSETIDGVIDGYWRDFDEHRADFMPAFLANDILRLWRTFCVNYEASTATDPPVKKAKRKLKNYKLKHNRLLTCYSGLAFLLARFVEKGTVNLDDANELVQVSPIERIQGIAARPRFAAAAGASERLLECYERFLATTDAPEPELVERFMNAADSGRLVAETSEFGDLMWDLFRTIGAGNRMLRMLIV